MSPESTADWSTLSTEQFETRLRHVMIAQGWLAPDDSSAAMHAIVDAWRGLTTHTMAALSAAVPGARPESDVGPRSRPSIGMLLRRIWLRAE